MTIVLTLVLMSLSGVNEAAAEVVQEYGPPDIYHFSWSQYTGQGTTNFEIQMLSVAYLDSLQSAVDSLYLELVEKYALAEGLLESLENAHRDFLEYTESWARLCEERMWWNLGDGTRSDGTARGYAYAGVLALYRWQKIVAYTLMLHSTSPWVDPAPDAGMLGVQNVGGYMPSEESTDTSSTE
ncbi:MAG: hypothetical protein GF388_11130 [Candidatus Aegiribacteria sp.]|nr:hypothetical protein [Candidatus Aegiribacteria sp.]MBD3295552.1 hypothetical protein [Candidatus Fermentibacteria bacterium]